MTEVEEFGNDVVEQTPEKDHFKQYGFDENSSKSWYSGVVSWLDPEANKGNPGRVREKVLCQAVCYTDAEKQFYGYGDGYLGLTVKSIKEEKFVAVHRPVSCGTFHELQLEYDIDGEKSSKTIREKYLFEAPTLSQTAKACKAAISNTIGYDVTCIKKTNFCDVISI